MRPFTSVAIFIVGPCELDEVDRMTGGVTEVTTYPRYHPSACSNTYTSSPRSRLSCWAAISFARPALNEENPTSFFDSGRPLGATLLENWVSGRGRKG